MTFLSPPSSWRAVSSAAMRRIEREASSRFGLDAALLMENAGRALAQAVVAMKPARVVVLCGSGANGGDGVAAARSIAALRLPVRVVLARPPGAFGPPSDAHWRAFLGSGVPWSSFESGRKLLQCLHRADAAVDALAGTGASGVLRAPYADMAETLNRSRIAVVSADVPSGLDADTGLAAGPSVMAHTTVAMGLPKTGTVRRHARAHVGRLLVADIGLPRVLIRRYER